MQDELRKDAVYMKTVWLCTKVSTKRTSREDHLSWSAVKTRGHLLPSAGVQ